MPVSIPTLLAMMYVAKNPLTNRINILQKSYKYQYIILGSLFCIDNHFSLKNYNIMKLKEIDFLE